MDWEELKRRIRELKVMAPEEGEDWEEGEEDWEEFDEEEWEDFEEEW
jgi:hypothetical protein